MGRMIGVVEIPPVRSKVASWSHSPLLSPRRLGGQALLGWIVDRVRQASGLDDVVVVTDSGQMEIARARVPASVRLFDYHVANEDVDRRNAGLEAGPSPDGGAKTQVLDPLGRFAAIASELSASAIVRVVAGHPFVDPQLIERLLAAADRRSACDYVGFLAAMGRRSLYMRLGMVVEWVGATALEQAARHATEEDDRRDATRYVHSHPDQFQLRWLPLPPPFDRRDIRLSLEQHEDWEHAQVIFESLGAEGLAWPRIATLVANNPTLRARMERLNRVDRV
jgi:spore coat polysaccharide biosynthesis protein SpsF (cytidylyltransferase family)